MPWRVGNGYVTGSQFAAKLNGGNQAGFTAVTGVAKQSKNKPSKRIRFRRNPQKGKWIEIPVKLIDSVEVLGSAVIEGKSCEIVQLIVEQPTKNQPTAISKVLKQSPPSLQDWLDSEVSVSADETWPLRLALGDGSIPLRLALGDGTIPLRLRGGDGSIPLRGGDGSIPVRLLLELAERLGGPGVDNG